MSDLEFIPFSKIGRMKRECTITEKIDGTNAQIVFNDAGELLVGSRKREIFPNGTEGKEKGCDNYGFAQWVYDNREPLFEFLGGGRHYGEWAGNGIQRGYGLDEKAFFLFNTFRFSEGRQEIPTELSDIGLKAVPVLYQGLFSSTVIDDAMTELLEGGSMLNENESPEGIIVYHHAIKTYFKVTYEYDGEGKGENR